MLSRTWHDRGEDTMDGRDFHLPADAFRDLPAGHATGALQSQALDVDASPTRPGDCGGLCVGATDEVTDIDPSRSPA